MDLGFRNAFRGAASDLRSAAGLHTHRLRRRGKLLFDIYKVKKRSILNNVYKCIYECVCEINNGEFALNESCEKLCAMHK